MAISKTYQHILFKLFIFIAISFTDHFDECAAKAHRPKPKKNRSIDEMLTSDRESVASKKRKKTAAPEAAEPIDSDLDLSDQEFGSK